MGEILIQKADSVKAPVVLYIKRISRREESAIEQRLHGVRGREIDS